MHCRVIVVNRPGPGLFLGTASSLSRAGPAGLLLGYSVVATVCGSGKRILSIRLIIRLTLRQ